MRSKQYDILVVDDDADDRMMMGEAFAELNYHDRITMYDSGFAFQRDLEHLRELAPLPLLIVLDYNLPGADGAAVLSLLRSDPVLSAIPVVMYSTGMSRTQKEDCLYKGAIQCFEKGATFSDLLLFCRLVCEQNFGTQTTG